MDTAASIEDEFAPIPQVELSESCKCLGDQKALENIAETSYNILKKEM